MNSTSANAVARYRFEGHVLDSRTRELRDADGRVLPIGARAFDTLCVLIAHRDRLVSKNELLAVVWAGRVVEENNLTQAIASLRRVFGTDAHDHRFIVTVPGHGYRFIAETWELPPRGAGAPTSPFASQPAQVSSPTAVTLKASRRPLWGLSLLVLLFAFTGGVWWTHQRQSQAGTSENMLPSLAVVPFRLISDGDSDELLGMGLADTLVTRLSRVEGLRVHPLISSRRAIKLQDNSVDAARVLGAAWVVEGSLQHVGRRVRVNARLISAADGASLWSETFDTDAGQVFHLQDRIAGAITDALALGPPPRPTITSPCDGADPQAHRALLRAQLQLQRRGDNTLASFREAVERDPTCSRAHAGLAVALISLAHNDHDPAEIFPLARAAIDTALELDQDSAPALVAQGRYQQLHAWQWEESETSLRRALAINPSLADAHFAIAHLLVSTGRHAEGLGHMRQARALDPLSPLYHAMEGGFLTAAGQPEAARIRVDQALELEPEFWIALMVKGGMALGRGDAAEAVVDLQRAADRSHRNTQVLAVLALAHAAAGERAAVNGLRQELEHRRGTGYVPSVNLAAVHLAQGDPAAALDHLEAGYQHRDIRMVFLRADARWNSLRAEPRFIALANRMQLPGEAATGRY